MALVQISSRIGTRGFARKLYILLLITVVYLVQSILLGSEYVGDGIAIAYIAIEFISITENGVKMGAPMPPFVKNLLAIVKSKSKRKESVIQKIARHHSATTSGDYFSFWNYWKSKGWTKDGYHEIILPDGTLQLCYDAIYTTNGIANNNTYIYNICLVGNGAFTTAQE